ncbi:MAG: hypothetical protein O3B74_01220 [Proteobacteria bacterium]|nr:hypothetical protein [Pseudomonadota bacterium]MDA1308524.1 hypothetical protein [Pseudomonadota bacterium]
MAMPNVKLAYEVKPDSHIMLGRIAERYGLPDESKALRCLLDYAAMEGDWDEIFKKIRCRRCG